MSETIGGGQSFKKGENYMKERVLAEIDKIIDETSLVWEEAHLQLEELRGRVEKL